MFSKEIKKNILSIYQEKIKCAIRCLEHGDSYNCCIDDETNFYYPEQYFIQFSIDNSDYFVNEEYCITPKDVIKRIEDYIMPLPVHKKFLILKSFDSIRYSSKPRDTIEKILMEYFESEYIFLDFEQIYRIPY